MSTADIKSKDTNFLPATRVQETSVSASGAAEKEKAASPKPATEPLEIRLQKLYNSVEGKRKFVSLLEGYIGNEQCVTQIKKRIEEALNCLKELESLGFKELEERGIDHGQNNV